MSYEVVVEIRGMHATNRVDAPNPRHRLACSKAMQLRVGYEKKESVVIVILPIRTHVPCRRS